jgi:serine phosphatase RsbU (regulator of sigma subunit)
VCGLVSFAVSYAVPALGQFTWVTYFALTLVEIIRLEVTGRTVRREGAAAFVLSYAIFCGTIVLQILINFNLIDTVAGIREVYLIGLLSSAAGMSLYLARRIGQSRIIAAENRRRSEELAQARELQLSMLPRELPSIARLDVAASTQTAAEVGGDYYDVRRDGDGALLFAFGDATGHGLAAGIVVTAAKALFNSFDTSASPRDLLVTCDRTLRAMQLPTLRMCLTLARVSGTEVVVASAAMPPLLIHRKASGAIDELGTGGLPLGSRLSSDYETRQTVLNAGDTLLFASDGFAELENADGRQLGYEAVATTFRDAAQSATAREVMAHLEAAAGAFRGTRPPGDDITLVVVRVG